MRKYLLLAAVALTAVSSPALARDGQPYVGIEGGVLFPKEQDGDVFVDFTTTQSPATPVVAGPVDFESGNAFGLDYKTGYDVDLIAGYDFGMFRLEGELGFKRSSLDELNIDDSFIAALNAGLNRPSAPPDPAAPGVPAFLPEDFELDDKVQVASLMLNGLADFGD
jgi:opacity protein-like surface antigen